MKWLHINNYVIVNNSNTLWRACLHANFVYYLLSLLSGANANLAAQPLAWLLSGEAIAAKPTDVALVRMWILLCNMKTLSLGINEERESRVQPSNSVYLENGC